MGNAEKEEAAPLGSKGDVLHLGAGADTHPGGPAGPRSAPPWALADVWGVPARGRAGTPLQHCPGSPQGQPLEPTQGQLPQKLHTDPTTVTPAGVSHRLGTCATKWIFNCQWINNC